MEKRRCLVPFDGFYEWKKINGKKKAYRIVTTDQDIFAIAGLWDRWKNEQGAEIYSFTLITREPNEKLSMIHDRMPAILLREQEALWLSNELSPAELVEMLEPYPDDYMTAYPVSDRVNNVRNNDASLIEKISDE